MSAILSTAIRGRVIAEALRWVGTPYRSRCYPVRGERGGCDCASILLGIAVGAGLVRDDTPLPVYSADRHLHRSDETYRETLRDLGFTEIPAAEAQPGDVLLLVMGRGQPASHSGVLVEPDRIVHAYQTTGKVCVMRLDARWRARIRFAFRFPGVPA